MKKTQGRYSALKRLFALVLAFVMVAGYFPTTAGWKVSAATPGAITTVADPETLTRPTDIYGDNTLNAGKVTVGKSVSDSTVTLPKGSSTQSFTPAQNNFIVTISQSAQVMGLSSETSVPVDVVFVLDTSGSMEGDRATSMVTAANNAIKTLMEANENNRVAVVAFSSAAGNWQGSWRDWGQGTSNGAAANVLSPLAHYDDNTTTQTNRDDAASNHLQWADSDGDVDSDGVYILGRSSGNVSAGYRRGNHEDAGGTNIHAGIALGAQQLMNVPETETTVTYADGTKVTRMPFIIVLSDGAPTYASSSTNWYNPSQTAQNGDGSDTYTGNGFLAALTAAYYKGAITEYYYGENADNDNRCNIYTIGVSISNDTLATLTLNPKDNFNANANNNNSDSGRFASYWRSYNSNNLTNGFTVVVDDNENFRVTNATISTTKNYVTGNNSDGEAMYTEGAGITYNDGYYSATQTSEIAGIFQNIVNEISKKAISSPTKVTDYGDKFSGYVHFSDPIGEYMEVKDMKGIIADGYFYQGASFAKLLATYNTGTSAEQQAFNALLESVLNTRMTMSSSSIDLDDFIQNAVASPNQAYWKSNTDFDNSIVWWGSEEIAGTNHQVQVLGFADNDTVEFIESAKAHDALPENADSKIIPNGAKYVCRSYFFYGAAGGDNPNPNNEYMYFMVRVQRSLEAPYQETVIISAPASLLSMEKVLITEGANGTFSATVEAAQPARVVYEVGLRSDINAQNVEQIIADDYKNETANGTGSDNYDAATGTYNFFTNDWDRTQSLGSHERAMTEATFEAAADNPFYTYQEDTLLVDANGNAATYDSANGGTYYYERTYYDWSNATTLTDNVYQNVQQKTERIKVELSAGLNLTVKDGKYYIPAGVYAASTLQTTGDDVIKGDDPTTPAVEKNNATGTSEIVSHAHRTNSFNDNHYTVKLGNNGKLSIVADPPKSVSIGNSGTNDDGKTVMVGDKLTYTIKAVNSESSAATLVITDTVPTGTKLVENSISNDGDLGSDGKTITWTFNGVAAGASKTVSFQVEVLQDALAGDQNVQNITNTGTIKIGNNPAYNTNTTTNPPEGKKVVVDENESVDGIQVGDTLTYRIRFYNDTNEEATVTVKDVVPAGTTFVSADHGGELKTTGEDAGKIVWTITNVQPGYSGVVSFDVKVDASAKQTADGTQPENGEISITNNAKIQIGTNGPEQTTNTTVTKVKTGDVAIEKVVAEGITNTSFYVSVTEETGTLNGTYVMTSTKNGTTTNETITFENGAATPGLAIYDGETLTIKGLPEGTVIYVEEYGLTAGWSAKYEDNDGGSDPQRVAVKNGTLRTVKITNTYRVSPVKFQLKGTKKFENANDETYFPSGTFTFSAVECDANGSPKSDPITVTANAVSSGTTGDVEIVFSEREFTTEFERYYLLTEAGTDIPGVTVSGRQYLLHLKVEDKNAQLTVTATLKYRDPEDDGTYVNTWTAVDDYAWDASNTDKDLLLFTNTYAPKETSITFGGTKKLSGRVMTDNEFGFEIVEVITNGENKTEVPVSTALVKASADDAHNGTYSFDPITYTKDGTHTYRIRELQGNNDRITYDDSYYELEVTVTDKGGQLEAEVTNITKYDNDAASTSTTVTVANDKYAFSNTFTPAGISVPLSGTKELSGAAADGLTEREFTFTVYESDASGNKIDFNDDNIIEEYAAYNTADSTPENGKYSAAISFQNIQFTAEDMRKADGTFETTKTFYYVIAENIPTAGDPNTYYDSTRYLVSITLNYDNESGSITPGTPVYTVVGDSNNATTNVLFSNVQNDPEIIVNPEVNKATYGNNLPDGITFSFRITDMDGNFIVSGSSTPTNAIGNTNTDGDYSSANYNKVSNNTVTFQLRITSDMYEAAEKDADGNATFSFIIEESNAGTSVNNGVTYDTTKYVYEVVIKRNATNALVKVSDGYYKNDDSNKASVTPTFNNVYAAETYINLTTDKKLTGREMKLGEFDFRIQRLLSDGQIAGMVVNGDNTAAGATSTVKFNTLYFSNSMLTGYNKEDGAYYIDYLLSEVDTGIAGIDYDEHLYIVRVKLTQAVTEGQPLTAEVVGVYEAIEKTEGNATYYSADTTKSHTYTKSQDDAHGWTLSKEVAEAFFINSYATVQGTSAAIEATKTLTGRDIREGEFTFDLYHVTKDDEGNTVETKVATAANGYDADGNGKIEVSELALVKFTRNYPATMSASYFDQGVATLIYKLVEVEGILGGVTYDKDTVYYAKVVIKHDTDDASLKLDSVTYWKNEACTEALDDNNKDNTVDQKNVIFTNKYESTTASYTPVADKLLLGAVDPDTNEREVLELGGNLYSFEVYELTMGTDGTWTKGASPVSVGANAANDLISDPVKESGVVEFSPISYSHSTTKSHYYAISEVEGSIAGVTYDSTEYYMAVEIYDDGYGKLYVMNAKYYTSTDFDTATPFYTETFYTLGVEGKPVEAAQSTSSEEKKATFTNHYGPGYVNIQLDIDKKMTLVGTNSYQLQDSQFDFTVRMTDGTDTEGNFAPGKGTLVTRGTNDADGNITFGSITIEVGDDIGKNAGDLVDLVYEIMEETPSDAAVQGITIDSEPIYAHVRVVNDGYGNLSYTVVYREGKENTSAEISDAAFTNTYTAQPVDFSIVAHKHLTGKTLAADEFKFELYDKVPSTEGAQPIKTTTNNAKGEVVFQMHYEQPGTYVYYLLEAGKGSGAVDTGTYGMDDTVYVVTVEVADDTQGKLYIKDAKKTTLATTYGLRAGGPTQITGMEFHNTFTPAPLPINLTTDIGGTKSVVDAEGNIRDELAAGFEFRVLDIQNKPAFIDDQGKELYAKSNADGKIELPDFKFEEAGEYHYWIFEKDVQAPFTKDSAIYEIHILVHKNMDTGKLYIIPDEVMTFAYSGVSTQAEGDPAVQSDEDAVVFVNKYEPTPVTVTITADKTLTGRDMKAGEFTFHLVETINGVDFIRGEATNDAKGNITFKLTYVTDGTHTYSIHEHVPADEQKAGGVTYDTKVYKDAITVDVTEAEGKLVAKVGDKQDTSFGSGVTIKNSYTAKPVTAVVEANKILTGGLALKADDFTFQLKDEEDNVVATAKNAADGKIKLEVPFEHKDLNGQISETFAYTIHEVKGEIPGVVYDETAYKVFITVTDDLQGNLVYAVTYEIGMAPTFHNVYETDDAVVTIKATKKLVGNTLKGDDFQFLLLDKDKNEVAAAKNDKDGNIIFNFTLMEAGTYEYTIVEVAHEDNHYSHDNHEYKVTVKVNDNGEGKLIAEDPVYEKAPIFENTYTPDGIQVTVEASKQLSGGKTLKGNDFEFQLLDKDDEVVTTAKNGADGKIKFEIPYEFKDLGGETEKTFTYTMVEKAGNDPAHYHYDSTEYTVTVKVVNDNGELKATVTYGTDEGKAPVFQNTWKPEKIGISLTGTKTLTGRDMKAGEFKFQVHDSTDTLVATGTNDAKGKITFTPVSIVTKGTYLLTVSEVEGNADYVTYDKSTFQVKVVVENVDGVLVPTVTYVDGDIEFENSYDEPANPETGDEMPIYWLIGLLIFSAAAIALLIIFRPRKGGKYLSK